MNQIEAGNLGGFQGSLWERRRDGGLTSSRAAAGKSLGKEKKKEKKRLSLSRDGGKRWKTWVIRFTKRGKEKGSAWD